VQADVKKREESQHTAKADKVGKVEKFAKWRDAEGENEKAQRPITGGVLNELDGIRAKIVGKETPNQNAQGHETEQENEYFGPISDEDGAHEVFLA
jgi:predicted metal-dependent peptidase